MVAADGSLGLVMGQRDIVVRRKSQVQQLELENERLRRRIETLEHRLFSQSLNQDYEEVLKKKEAELEIKTNQVNLLLSQVESLTLELQNAIDKQQTRKQEEGAAPRRHYHFKDDDGDDDRDDDDDDLQEAGVPLAKVPTSDSVGTNSSTGSSVLKAMDESTPKKPASPHRSCRLRTVDDGEDSGLAMLQKSRLRSSSSSSRSSSLQPPMRNNNDNTKSPVVMQKRKTLPREQERFLLQDKKDNGASKKNNNKEELIHVKRKPCKDAQDLKGLYTGTLVDGAPHGRGLFDYGGGCCYEGEWKRGQKCGYGALYTKYHSAEKNVVYQGMFENDVRHGQGMLKFRDGRTCLGTFERDALYHGLIQDDDGAMYEGQVVEDYNNNNNNNDEDETTTCVSCWSRYSSMSCAFAGEFPDVVFHGKGKMVWNDGSYYDGEWNMGERHGYGVQVDACGQVEHEGQWENGAPRVA